MAIGNFLTTKDVATRLGVTVGRVRQFVMAQRLVPLKKIGNLLFFDPEHVNEFAQKERRPGRKKAE